ncbi:MAG TPA: hypothetical protein VFL60_02345 [Gaiellaceae bacterium]|nr:hypothetical protein [Gaiellaceae bacterium]
MRRHHVRLAATCAFAVATALFTAFFVGAALADPGHGHGNSGSASGHYQQQWQQPQSQPVQPAPQQQPQQSGSSHQSGSWHGHQSEPVQPAQPQSQSQVQAQSQVQSQQSAGSSTQAGVKPSSTTQHWTHTTVGAKPDVSKRYGNGKTAAEIAASRGAPASQPLTGPGNSQPHKTYDCGHKNNPSGGVDVHAIKHYSATGCTSGSSQQSGGSSEHGSCGCVSGGRQPNKPTTVHVTAPVQIVGYCHQVNGRWVYSTTTTEKLAEIVKHEDVIAPSFSYQGHVYSKHWDTNGQSIYNRCRHGESVSATSPTKTPEQPQEHKVTLCHATGSATNPYVMITVDYHALKNGHTAAKGDIIPPTTINGVTYTANWDTNGQAIFNNGCKPVAAAVTPNTTGTPTTPAAATPPPTTTVNEAPVIVTSPGQTVTTPGSTVTTPGSTVTVTTPAQTVTTPGSTVTVTTTASAGGVQGAQTSLAKPKAAKAKPNHGVLGTVTHVTGGTLPFTGFPVWLAVLVAAGLILGGLALRRRTAGARL